jgi:4-amino-4-deoxy-L-arabinose transferase-like glycosyltransferase
MARARPDPVWIVVLISAAVGLALALALPLFDPDEGRNAEVAREMAAANEILVPRLAGMPYLDKPPALFWAAAAPLRLYGPSRLAVRLPALLAAVFTLLVLARLARAARDAACEWRAAALLASAPLFIGLSTYVIFDMPLALCVTAVWTGLARECVHGANPGRRALMFAAVALGVLVKGPVMLAWAAGGSLAAALLMRAHAPLRWLGWWPGWLIVLGLAGGWFALALRAYPEYPRYAFLEESFERMATGSFKREQPWWFAPAVILGGALPWSLAALHPETWRVRARPESAVAAGFVLFALVFFTISRSKLVTYLLPALPPLAWLVAERWTAAARAGRRSVALYAAGLAVPALVLAFGLAPAREYMRAHSGEPLAAAIARAGGGPVRYEDCYSPGTDFMLGRTGTVVSASGNVTTSTYQLRYRERLIARGQWTPLDRAPEPDTAAFVVRSASAPPAPDAGEEIFRDRRFVAYRRAAP